MAEKTAKKPVVKKAKDNSYFTVELLQKKREQVPQAYIAVSYLVTQTLSDMGPTFVPSIEQTSRRTANGLYDIKAMVMHMD